MNFNIKVNGNDFSDYIISCDNIPVVSRNRNWEFNVNDISFVVSSACPYDIAKGYLVHVYFDTTIRYAGYINSFRELPNNFIEINVTNYLSRLSEIMIDYTTLHQVFNNTITLHIGSIYYEVTTDSLTDRVTFYNAGVFSGVTKLQFINVDGDMPTGIQANKYYYLRNIVDNTAQLSETPTGDILNIGSTGVLTGDIYWGEINIHKYNDIDSEGYPTVNLDWLFTCLLEKLKTDNPYDDISYDISLINNINLYKKDSTFYKLQDLAIDENMLYCLNQDFAGYHTLIDANPEYIVKKITALDLLKELCKIFGFAVAFVGTDATNKIKIKFYPQVKNADANPSPVYESLYSFTNNYVMDYDKIEMPAEDEGYAYFSPYNSRTYYSNDYGVITEPIPQNQIYSSGVKASNYKVLNNLRIFLRTNRIDGNIADSSDSNNSLSTTFLTLNHYYAKMSIWEKQTYTYPAIFTYLTVKEKNYNVAEQAVEIIQEKFIS